MGCDHAQRAGQELTSSRAAWDYPWTPAGRPGLLTGGRFTPRGAKDLLHEYADRAVVVGVGSNASPRVLHRKLCEGFEDDAVPLLPGILVGCAVGHSAHVSLPGYVAAAPYRDPRAQTPVHVSLLDNDQLRRLDATEPNYVRRRFANTGRYRVVLDTDEQPRQLHLYDARWGVIGPPGRDPVRFTTQQALHALLRAQWPPYEQLLGERHDAGVEELVHALATDEGLRNSVRDALRSTGWAHPSGLAG